MLSIKLSDIEDKHSQYTQDFITLRNSLLQEREDYKFKLKLMSDLIFYRKTKVPRANSKMPKAITSSFTVYDIEKCAELDKSDILEREKQIFKRLAIPENAKDIKRFDEYLGKDFSKNELISYLLFLKEEYKLNLDECIVLVDGNNFLKLFPYAEGTSDFNVYGINIGSDYFYPSGYKCLDSRLVIIPKTYEMAVYRDELTVAFNLNRISYVSYNSYLPEIKSNRFFTIKLKA